MRISGIDINNQSAKKGSKWTIYIMFSDFFFGETTTPPLPQCEKIKNLPSWALYDPLQLMWKFSCITYIGNRRFEGKITHIFF